MLSLSSNRTVTKTSSNTQKNQSKANPNKSQTITRDAMLRLGHVYPALSVRLQISPLSMEWKKCEGFALRLTLPVSFIIYSQMRFQVVSSLPCKMRSSCNAG